MSFPGPVIDLEDPVDINGYDWEYLKVVQYPEDDGLLISPGSLLGDEVRQAAAIITGAGDIVLSLIPQWIGPSGGETRSDSCDLGGVS
jgi:hypothetical protein